MIENQIVCNISGIELKVSELRVLVDSTVALTQSESYSAVARILQTIASDVIHCGAVAINVYDKEIQSDKMLLSAVRFGADPRFISNKISNQAIRVRDFLERWRQNSEFIYLEQPYSITISSQSWLSRYGIHQIDNSVIDGVTVNDKYEICYFLINIDKAMLEKYRIIMQLLLPFLQTALLRAISLENSNCEDVQRLTNREREILCHIRKGLNNKLIARRLDISIHTVKCHIYNIFQKLNVSNRVEALLMAERVGMLH